MATTLSKYFGQLWSVTAATVVNSNPSTDFLKRASNPHFNHRSTPGEIEIGVIERTGFQAGCVRGFTDGFHCKFPSNKNRRCRLRQEGCRRDSANSDARVFYRPAVLSRAHPRSNIQDGKID